MREPSETPRSTPAARWADLLGLNASTLALLAAILLVTASTELWSPLIPEYIQTLRRKAAGGAPETLLWIALYGSLRDLMEAINYYAGGAIGGRLDTRRSLLLFNLLPLAGLALVAAWPSWAAVFVALPLLTLWDSLAGPAIIAVVGDSVAPERRATVFAVQAIVRRLARLLAYGVSAATVWWAGREMGFRAAAAMGVLLLVAAALLQFRLMKSSLRDAAVMSHAPLQMLRGFDPQLRRLLAADVLARWAEGMPRELIILFCIPLLNADRDAAAAAYAGVLLVIQAVVNVACYLFIAPRTSRAGLAKKPFIGWTFAAFAAFPLALATLGPALGFAGLAAAFVVGGLRELGEPARKAMISELVDPALRMQATGLYWAIRSAAVMLAPLVGGAIWVAADRLKPGAGPVAMLIAASAVGWIGAALFFARFGRDTAAGPPRTRGA